MKIKNCKLKIKPLTGFTLIELLVVIAIIGVVSGVVTVGMQKVRQKGRDSMRLSDMCQIQKAIAMYETDKEHYPKGYSDGAPMTEQTPELLAELAYYLPTMPQEPSSDKMAYTYISDAHGTGYKIICDLEVNPQMEIDDKGCYNDLYELFSSGFADIFFSASYYYDYYSGGGFSLKFEDKDYVDVGVFNSDSYTLEAWVELSASQSEFESDIDSLICRANGFCEAKGAALAIGGLEPAIYHARWVDLDGDEIDDVSKWSIIKSGVNLGLNQWHFLTATYDGETSEVSIYVDGQHKKTEYYNFAADTDMEFFVGQLSLWSDEEAPGYLISGSMNIDEIRVYNYDIGLENAAKHFEGDYSNEGIEPWKDPKPKGYWSFEEGSGGTTEDISGHNPDGELKPSEGEVEEMWSPN